MELNGSAIITGAGSGIGRATAVRFAELGCVQLLLVDMNHVGLEETKSLVLAASFGANVICDTCDLTVDDQDGATGPAANIVRLAVEAFGRLDHLVNCAGVNGGKFAAAADLDVSIFDAVQRLNVRATWLLQRAAIQQMLKQTPVDDERGSIVNIGSIVSHIGQKQLSAYVTSKHAVLGLTHAEAADYAPFGIRVNCVAPGLIETNFGGAIPKEVQDRELKPLIEKTPLGRTGKPREVANVVAFLCSRSASYVTGTSVAVDGGLLGAR